MKNFVKIILVLVLALTIIGCNKETEQDKVKKVIMEIQTAAEQKDVNKIINNLSTAYSDPQGYNHEAIKGLLLGYFFRYPKVSVYLNSLEITVDDTSSRALFQAVLTSGKKTGSLKDIIPHSLGIYDFDVWFAKESGDWKITSAKWEEALIDQSKEVQ